MFSYVERLRRPEQPEPNLDDDILQSSDFENHQCNFQRHGHNFVIMLKLDHTSSKLAGNMLESHTHDFESNEHFTNLKLGMFI